MKIEQKPMRYGDILNNDKLVMCEGEYWKYRGDENGTYIVYSRDEYIATDGSPLLRKYKDNYVRYLDGDVAFTRIVDDTTRIAPFYCIIRLYDNPIEMMMKHFKNINK